MLIVEDDEAQAIAVRIGLEREGFAVTWAGDGASALELFSVSAPDVVIVDAMLPGLSGIEVCRRIKQVRSTVPVIVVSARSDEFDVVIAMETGADDFLVKPFSIRVLVARIRALLRRSPPRQLSQSVPTTATAPCGKVPVEANSRVLVVDDLLLDPDRHEVYVRGEPVELTRQEFRLLEELLREAGLLLLRRTLLERMWSSDFEGNGKILSTLINRLRARIEDDPENPVRIVTIRGLGYRYERQRYRERASDHNGTGTTGHGFARLAISVPRRSHPLKRAVCLRRDAASGQGTRLDVPALAACGQEALKGAVR